MAEECAELLNVAVADATDLFEDAMPDCHGISGEGAEADKLMRQYLIAQDAHHVAAVVVGANVDRLDHVAAVQMANKDVALAKRDADLTAANEQIKALGAQLEALGVSGEQDHVGAKRPRRFAPAITIDTAVMAASDGGCGGDQCANADTPAITIDTAVMARPKASTKTVMR